MATYKPGLHILSSFSSSKEHLVDLNGVRTLFNALISELGLEKVGEVYHEFPNGSFTAVVCLTESHISIHTWPEYEHATFDVFLSNYQKDNSDKVKTIYERTLSHFDGKELNKQEIKR